MFSSRKRFQVVTEVSSLISIIPVQVISEVADMVHLKYMPQEEVETYLKEKLL